MAIVSLESPLTKTPQVHLQEMISKEEIADKVADYAKILDEQYAGKEIIILAIMKGALCITADLIRAMDSDTQLKFIRCSSYGMNGTDRGELQITGFEDVDVSGKHVLIVDDICDSGVTLSKVVSKLKEKMPANIQSLVLLHRKSEAPSKFNPDFSLFEIEKNDFVVGYGLDYKECYRGLEAIYSVTIPPEMM
ncbi:MAG: hypoxanthine phosphoribosyltransferase [Chlamydiales bacterium]